MTWVLCASTDIKAYPLHVNILAPFIPSFEFKKMLSLYNGHVEFMEGSPVHQSDLERVCASHAAAIFLLANKQTNDTKVEDAAQIVRALAVNRHCGNKVRIIVEVLEPATQTCAVWDETESGAIEVICPAKIHYKMLSRRLLSLYPLPCPLICSLFVLSWLCFFLSNKQPCCKGPLHKLVIKSCG
jgi:potassium large conductance calcium-activated channel subfamily M alpha protein 1